MIPTGFAGAFLATMILGFVTAAGLIARLYSQPSTALWMWIVTASLLMTGGTSARRRGKHGYR